MRLTRALAQKVANYDDPTSLGSRLRRRRAEDLIAMIDAEHARRGAVRIIDVGGTRRYWNILPADYLEARAVEITLVNPAPPAEVAEERGFCYQAGDGRDLSGFADQSFQIAHSNSVVEHVGDWQSMLRFAREVSRVASRYFVQTPSYWFPIEPHAMAPFFHWLPKPLRVQLVRNVALGHWPRAATVDEAVSTVESARLLTRGMMQALFPDAAISTERLLLWPKSYVALR
jgi:hypothetical protein